MQIAVVGAAIMDIMGFPEGRLVTRDSVPGRVRLAPGGVGRNIAENLRRFGCMTSFVTTFGDDAFSLLMLRQLEELGLDCGHCLFLANTAGPVHLSLLDEDRDMVHGIAAMDVLQKMNPAFLAGRREWLNSQAAVVVEANIPSSSLEWLAITVNRPPLFLDPVSVPMATKVRSVLGRFHTLKANRLEAEALCGFPLRNPDDLRQGVAFLLGKGLRRVFITLGSEGCCYADRDSFGLLPAVQTTVVNTTGAGDAFLAGLVWASMRNFSLVECARMGLVAAAISLEGETAVNPLTSQERLMDAFLRLSADDI